MEGILLFISDIFAGTVALDFFFFCGEVRLARSWGRNVAPVASGGVMGEIEGVKLGQSGVGW